MAVKKAKGKVNKQKIMRNNQPKISIITVCFNEPKENIELTFNSVSSQSYKNIEWIVIDGGSKPETISEIKKYESTINKLVSEPDNGIYDAMNKGLSFAMGDFVIFMNTGDSFYAADTLAQVADFILSNPSYDCFYGDTIFIDNDRKEWASPQIRKVNRYTIHYSMVCHQSIIARKTLFDKTGGFDTSYKILADREWLLRSIDAGAKWKFMNMFICKYDGSGVSSDIKKRHIEADRFVVDNFNALENFVCYFMRKHRNLKQRVRKILRHHYKKLPIYYN